MAGKWFSKEDFNQVISSLSHPWKFFEFFPFSTDSHCAMRYAFKFLTSVQIPPKSSLPPTKLWLEMHDGLI